MGNGWQMDPEELIVVNTGRCFRHTGGLSGPPDWSPSLPRWRGQRQVPDGRTYRFDSCSAHVDLVALWQPIG
jgi:hypothetical protein